MSRLRRSALIWSCQSVTMPILLMRKTFEPRLATRCAKYRFMPLISATTRISVETERMMPSRVRNERSLWARIVCRAISADSRKKWPRDNFRGCGVESMTALEAKFRSAYSTWLVRNGESSPKWKRPMCHRTLNRRCETGKLLQDKAGQANFLTAADGGRILG